MGRKPRRWLGLLAVVALAAAVRADEPTPRGVGVGGKNAAPTFHVRVSADRADATYEKHQKMVFTVQATAAGHLYFFYTDADKNTSLLFPNGFQADNAIPAGKPIAVPPDGARFDLTTLPPFGKEVLRVVVTRKPLGVPALAPSALAKEGPTPLTPAALAAISDALKATPDADWAEHSIEITTVETRAAVPARAGKRVGLFVAVSRYADPKIDALPFARADAEQAAAVFKARCGLDEVVVLHDKDVTRAKLEEVIAERFPRLTGPGDAVVIFWSGHGEMIPAAGGAGAESVLLLADTLLPKFDTLNPEAFEKGMEEFKARALPAALLQRWLQNLDGRRILVVADVCRAGGLHARGRTLFAPAGRDLGGEGVFLTDLIRTSRSLDQKGLTLLASSTASQASFPLFETAEVSILTHFLLEALKDGGDELTLAQAFDRTRTGVAEYLKKKNADPEFLAKFRARYRLDRVEQTPVLIGQTDPPFPLRPGRAK